jgi:hypothetical protein
MGGYEGHADPNEGAMTETRTRAPSVLAWGLVGLTASLVVLGLVVPTFSPAPGATEPTLIDIGYGPASLAFAVVGALIATRRPRNSIGWLLCLVAIGISLLAWGDAPAAAPGGRWMISFGQLVWAIGFASLFLVLLLFPDGKVPSPGWRISFYRAKFDAAQTLEGSAAKTGRLVP